MRKSKERLQKILSANGIASRREAERMIQSGRVFVNGAPAVTGQSTVLGVDEISVDNKPLTVVTKRVYLMLNKPCGYLTAAKDERGRKTVMELVSGVGGRIFPVGRLDLNTEGLLLFTNDGSFANIIMHPSFDKEKTYEADVLGDVDNAAELMSKPMDIDGYTVNARKVEVTEKTETGGVIRITIAEGRNRQVRKMCSGSKLKVIKLKRISIGELELGELKSGHWRYLTEREVLSLGKGHITRN